jgi:hypothetical protein
MLIAVIITASKAINRAKYGKTDKSMMTSSPSAALPATRQDIGPRAVVANNNVFAARDTIIALISFYIFGSLKINFKFGCIIDITDIQSCPKKL